MRAEIRESVPRGPLEIGLVEGRLSSYRLSPSCDEYPQRKAPVIPSPLPGSAVIPTSATGAICVRQIGLPLP